MRKLPASTFGLLTTLFLSLIASGCSGAASGEGVASASETAAATVSGAVSSGAQGKLAWAPARNTKSWRELLLPSAWAATSCPTTLDGVAGLNCEVDDSGKSLMLAYNSCNFGNNSAVWDGALILTSSAPVSCGSVPSQDPGATLLRTFAPGTTRAIGNSVHVAQVDTATPSGFETPVSGGSLTTYVSASRRTLEIKGIHVLSQKIFRGNGNSNRVQTEADHTLSTVAGSALEMTITAEGDVTVNGTVLVQHNLARYVGASVFEDVKYVAGCCHPQAGTVTTTLRGSRTGTETLEFTNSECGSAKFKNEQGGESSLTLSRCF